MNTTTTEMSDAGPVNPGFYSTFVASTSDSNVSNVDSQAQSNSSNENVSNDHGIDSTIQQLSWQLLKNIQKTEGPEDFGRQLVNQWKQIVKADQVFAVCKRPHSQSKVIAVSGLPCFDSNSVEVQQVEQIANSMTQSSDPANWPNQEPSNDANKLLETLTRTNGFQSVEVSPLVETNGKNIGHVITFWKSISIQRQTSRRLAEELFPTLANQLALLLKVEGSPFTRFIRQSWKHLVGHKKVFWLILIGLVTAAMAMPLDYRVSCQSTLEPTSKRYVSSPFEGKLKQSLVEPGQEVTEGQILALIDGDEFRLELAAAQAELEREKERNQAALQEGRVSDARIAKLEMQKLRHDIARFQRKIESLEVKSPVTGLVVSGDLEQSIGAPLEQGQTLFEIGPIDKLNIEIEIPEAEFRFIKPGQTVEVRFHAFPLQSFQGTIASIHPRAEIRDDNVVFVAKAEIANVDGILRPGMKGNAIVSAGSGTLGWNLFHHPINRFRSSMGW